MPRDLFLSKIDLDLAYPPFLDKLFDLLAWARGQGIEYLVTELFRTWERSTELHAAFLKGGPRAAPAGLSPHNYGLAADTALIIQKAPRVVRWGARDFDKLAEGCDLYGLIWGGKFNDADHVSWAEGTALVPLRKLYEECPADTPVKQKLAHVWAGLKGSIP